MTFHTSNNKDYLTPVLEEIAAISNWFDEEALPLWISNGFDYETGIFHERLDMQAQPFHNISRRLFVQCRQIAVYSYATLRGRHDAKEQILKSFARIKNLYYNPHKKGYWYYSVGANGEVDDDKLDSYTLAFVIFALAWLYRLEPSECYIEYADEIFSVFDGPLAAQGGGVIIGIPESSKFTSQNPNMHLFEACLVLYEAAGRPQDLQRAEKIANLFEKKLFDHCRLALPENHTTDWQVTNPSQNWFEPGHHFEWAWLLRQLERVGGRSTSHLIAKILSPALEVGLDANSVVIERVGLERNFIVNSSRNWGVCEYLKCCSNEYQEACWRNDVNSEKIWALRTLDGLRALRRVFLSTPHKGLWHDRVDSAYNCLTNYSPASSFYHISFSIAEIEKIFTRYISNKISFSRKKRATLFLDRDGVVNVDIGYAYNPEQITFVPGIFDLVRKANEKGYYVFVVTNQSGVARSYYSESNVIALHEWMADQFHKNGANISAFYHCPYMANAVVPNYNRRDHFDRKPNAGMLKRAALEWHIDFQKSLLVGDNQSDCMAATAVGVASLLIKDDHHVSLQLF